MELPFLTTSGVQGAKVFWRVYEKYLSSEFENTKILWMFTSGPGQIYTTKKAVNNIEDLQGMKIRTPGAMVSKMLKELGAVPVSMPITEVYMALERGTIDGICAPWSVIRPFRLYEQIKYATEIDIYTQSFFVTMNKAKYNTLSDNLKQIFDENIGEKMALIAGTASDESDLPSKEMSIENGVELITLSEDQKQRWRHRVQSPIRQQWLDEMDQKGLPGDETLSFLLHELEDIVP